MPPAVDLIVPDLSGRMPAIALRSELLPAPFGPTTAVKLAGANRPVIPATAKRVPYATDTSLSSTPIGSGKWRVE